MPKAATPPDWLSSLSAMQSAGERLPLTDLRTDDLVKIATARSTYFFRITEPRRRLAEMWKQGTNAAPISVQIMGCTLGLSSTIDPRSLFCGGSLEYTTESGARTHTSSAIKELASHRKARA
jgi:hypothetical protein